MRISLKKKINQLNSAMQSCRCNKFSVKQVVKEHRSDGTTPNNPPPPEPPGPSTLWAEVGMD